MPGRGRNREFQKGTADCEKGCFLVEGGKGKTPPQGENKNFPGGKKKKKGRRTEVGHSGYYGGKTFGKKGKIRIPTGKDAKQPKTNNTNQFHLRLIHEKKKKRQFTKVQGGCIESAKKKGC